MKILAIISQKGGVGKTTIAMALAVAAQAQRQEVAVFDLDNQASASFLASIRKAAPLVVVDTKPLLLERDLGRAREAGADLVIIDCPPDQSQAYAAAQWADLVLIPTPPDVLDVRSMRATVALAQSIGKPCSVVLSKCPIAGPEIEQARALVSQMGVDMVPVILHLRKAYARAQQDGLAVQEYEPEGKAAAEIQNLYSHIHTLLHGGKHGKAQGKRPAKRLRA